MDLDGSGDSLRYEVEIRSGAEVLEVHVDAVTGDIISTTPEDSDADDDDDDAPQVCTGTISLDEAREIAEAEAGGSAVEVESDDCEFEIVVDTAAGLVEVEVSGDGTVQEVEAEDDESGDDGDDGAESDDDDDDDDAESDDD